MTASTVLSVNPNHPEAHLIAEAARILNHGGLVAFPTETVYGLAADAANPKAIERLNQVKGRPPEKPYSIHLYATTQLGEFVDVVPPLAQRLIERFWPGPLTIVMPARAALVAAGGPARGQTTVGFRLPDHPVAQAFLRQSGRAVVAPSANRSGFQPPTDGREVVAALDGQFDCLLDAGPTPLGRESTVVSVVSGRVEILREGAIPAQTIHAVLGA